MPWKLLVPEGGVFWEFEVCCVRGVGSFDGVVSSSVADGRREFGVGVFDGARPELDLTRRARTLARLGLPFSEAIVATWKEPGDFAGDFEGDFVGDFGGDFAGDCRTCS